MKPAPWPEVDEVLGAALALAPEQRLAFLDQRCGANTALRAEVEALLEHATGAAGFLESPAATRVMAGAAGLVSDITGKHIGPYRLTEEIGRGGMGAVWRAERDDEEFSMQVAIKLLFPGGPQIHSPHRLRAEQRILARLEHPNIARLLDAGATAEGLPYIVMEYVDGKPITDWCRERSLGLRERIELFRGVCRAVHFAHQSLVVHRDLKPANILVNAQGVPKLLDFGIARLISDASSGGESAETIVHAMTIDYASPEQVRCEPATTAGDLYSLGVVLYELLSGRRPWSLGGKTLTEILRVVNEQEPAKPNLGDELDSIILKSLRKTPADRYGSAQELADDLGRYLAGMPVEARRGSFGYLARKLVARYKMQVAVAAAAFVLLFASGAAVLWQAQVAAGERARRRSEVGRLVQSLIFETHDEIARLAGSTPVRKRLVERTLGYLDAIAKDRGGRDYQYELASGYTRLASVQGNPSWANLGDRAGALASYGKARAILEEIVRHSPGERRARVQLATLLLDLHQLQDRQDALASVSQAESLVQQLLAGAPRDEEILALLGSTRYAQSTHESETGRLRRLEEALEIYGRLLASQPGNRTRQRNVALMHKYIAASYLDTDPARMLRHIRDAQALDEKRVAAEPNDRLAKLDLSFDLSMLADYFRNQGDLAKVTETFKDVVALRRDLWRTDPQDARARGRMAYALHRLGLAEIQTGALDSARANLQEALGHATALSPGGPETGLSEILSMATLGLGDIHSRRKQRGQACRAYQVALEHLRQMRPTRYTSKNREELAGKIRTACAPN